MKILIIFSLMILTNCSGSTIQPIPEDETPLSALPFDFDTFCKEKLDFKYHEDLRDTENFRERLLPDTTALGKSVASQLNSLRTTYMVLARKEKFTLYFFRLLRETEGKYSTVNVLATAKGSDILSVLEQPLNNQGNGIPTFTVMTDLTIDIYSARMEQRMFGTKTKDGIGWVPEKEHKTATYTVGKEGIFTMK